MKKQLLLSLAALSVGTALAADICDVRLKGYVADRLGSCVENHVLKTDATYLSRIFCYQEDVGNWQTEFWGKYMHSAAPFWRYTGDATLKARMDESMRQIVAHQLPDGYIGNYKEGARSDKGWDVWGNKYTMLGLLHYYDVTGDRTALDAAAKLCDYASAGDTWQEDSAYRVWLPTVLPLPERSSTYRAGTPIVSASYLDGRTTAANHR